MIEARESLAVGPGDVVQAHAVRGGGPAGARDQAARRRRRRASEPVSYRIERLDGPRMWSRPAGRRRCCCCSGGRYRVEGRYGVMNARVVREVEVKAGQTQQLTLEHQAANLKLRLGGGGRRWREVFWDVRDEAGNTVWTTGQPEPSATLQAGRYRVRAETREKRYERAVELRAGDNASSS